VCQVRASSCRPVQPYAATAGDRHAARGPCGTARIGGGVDDDERGDSGTGAGAAGRVRGCGACTWQVCVCVWWVGEWVGD